MSFTSLDKKSTSSLVINSKKFSIVIPPPNVTGSLHMGHALNNSIQDLLVRYYRMNNYETLWQPGTDHAGIATQAVVEKNLATKNIKKGEIGRSKFLDEVWKWKDESGNIILDQLKKLGCSCDWSRNRFTMDKDLSSAVTKVFVELYNNKLIFKDLKSLFEKRGFIINWKALEKQSLDETINALAMASPFSLEEKQILLEAQNLDNRKEKISQILSTYTFDNFDNTTIQ